MWREEVGDEVGEEMVDELELFFLWLIFIVR